MADQTSILKKTFTANLVREYSAVPSVDDLGTHEQTMELFYYTGANSNQGFIEWDIPSADECEHIGLTFEFDKDGKRTLTDYDGTMSLPEQAVLIMREAGIIVSNEYDDACTFEFDGATFDYWEFIQGNDAATLEWALHAMPGDVCPHASDCTRIA